MITALAALIQLGPDFRFTTTLETKGNVDNGILKGDVIARFGGDPTLRRQDIRNMVATLKSQASRKSTAMCLSTRRFSPATIKRQAGRGTT
ncbi:penicillin-binding protein [Salmonella enterica subsp. enterica serovar Madelia]|nr:penicillin-binding protein [Salmonella enterica subsp. enterica serovar Madelia]